MSLQGSVETIRLPELLTLLAVGGKTGSLRVEGPRLDARLWLRGGQLVGAQVGSTRTYTDALSQLVRLPVARFAFEPGDEPEDPAEPVPLEPLLAEAQRRVVEWQEIESAVPSLAAVVRLSPELAQPKVVLQADQWRLLVAAVGRRVADALDDLALGELEGCRALKELIDAGLISIEVAQGAVDAGPRPGRRPEAGVKSAGSGPVAPEAVDRFEPLERPGRGRRGRRRHSRSGRKQSPELYNVADLTWIDATVPRVAAPLAEPEPTEMGQQHEDSTSRHSVVRPLSPAPSTAAPFPSDLFPLS